MAKGGGISCRFTSDSLFRMDFRWDSSVIDEEYRNNRAIFTSLDKTIKSLDIESIDSVVIVAKASPEGVLEHNNALARRRANAMRRYVSDRYPKLEPLLRVRAEGEAWEELRSCVVSDDVMSQQEKQRVLRILDNETISVGTRKWRLERDARYGYLYRTYYPILRNSTLLVIYVDGEQVMPIALNNPLTPDMRPRKLALATVEQVVVPVPDAEAPDTRRDRVLFALKSNMLYDAALVPNMGAELYLGGRISLNANWMYAWWSNNSSNLFWRIYGGDIGIRAWLGRKAKMKPLTGHHLGAYISAFTYDFELGGRGYMGGEPGGDIFNRANYAVGVEYGYSLPIARRLNIDFSVGVGYMWGTYHEYLPIDGCYVWQVTKNRHYWGPIKAEVSLVWLIGRGNVNEKKGGRR